MLQHMYEDHMHIYLKQILQTQQVDVDKALYCPILFRKLYL